MKNKILLFLSVLFIVGCSSESSENATGALLEDKVLVMTGSAIAYVGVLSGEIYNTKEYPYFSIGNYNKLDDKLYAMENLSTELQIVDAEQFRGGSSFNSLDRTLLAITGIDGISLTGPLFFMETGYVHISYIFDDEPQVFGIGKIDTVTGQFTSVYYGLQKTSNSTSFRYNAKQKKLYHFDSSSVLRLFSVIDTESFTQQIVQIDLGNIEFYAADFLSINFESNFDQNFYFTSKVGVQQVLHKFNCSTLQIENLGVLPTAHNNINSSFFVNSKNKSYYTSWRGSGYSICSYDFTTNVQTEVIISDINNLGTIQVEKVLFID